MTALPRRVANRLFHLLARITPGATTARPWLHRLRGVKIGQRAFIGEGVYIDNEYPECVEIHDDVQMSVRVIILAHTRGPGRVIISRGVFIGPNAVVVCGGGRVLKIAENAVIGAGTVVTKSVPAGLYLAPPTPVPLARVGVPLPLAKTMQEFWSGLSPLTQHDTSTSKDRLEHGSQ
jgi:heptaprenylglycerol acetyltransferase